MLALRAADRGTRDRDAEGAEAAPADPEPLGVELLIAVPDRPGVLPAAAGVLALHRLTVRAADLRALDCPPRCRARSCC